MAGRTVEVDGVLAAVGPRLRALRLKNAVTLAQLSASTGISVSTLSRLEAGQRKPNLELLLPLARAHHVPLDELVGAPDTGDPRVHLRPMAGTRMTVIPLTRRPGGIQAYKCILNAGKTEPPHPQVHGGYEWLYVLHGGLRVVLGDRDFVMSAGEAAEFDTHTPHWFGQADDHDVEFLSLFGRQGERIHLKAKTIG